MSVAHVRASLIYLIGVSVTRLCCALAIVKVLSVALGPAQFGILSQVMGIGAIFNMLAGGGATTGLIQAVSQERDPDVRNQWLAANLAIGVGAGLVLALVACIMLFTSGRALFGDPSMGKLFLGIAVAQFVVGLGNIVLAFGSATSQTRTFALINIFGTLLWAGITVFGTIALGFFGAQWAVTLAPICPALLALVVMHKQMRPIWRLMSKYNPEKMHHLLKFSGAMVVAVCAIPVVQLVIRADLAHRSGWQQVGHWQAVARLADAYMQVFGVLAINLLLPRLAAATHRSAWVSIMRRIGGAMLALFVIGAMSLYWLGGFVIRIAYSAEFLPAQEFLAPQLLADFSKVGAWILIYHFVATGRVWVQAVSEVWQAVAVLIGYFVLWPVHGAGAPVLANLAACVVLLIGLSIKVWNDKFRNRTPCGS